MLAVDGRFQANQSIDLHGIGNALQRPWTNRLGITISTEKSLAIAAQANLAGWRYPLDPAGQMHGKARRILLGRGTRVELTRHDLPRMQPNPDHGRVRQGSDGGA